MRYLLDTNTISHLMRANPITLGHLSQCGENQVFVSAISEAEIEFGLVKNSSPRLRRAVEAFWVNVTVLDLTSKTAVYYGSLRAQLESSGQPMSPLDTLIAATALEHSPADMVLVTNDHAFARVPKLRVEDWVSQ